MPRIPAAAKTATGDAKAALAKLENLSSEQLTRRMIERRAVEAHLGHDGGEFRPDVPGTEPKPLSEPACRPKEVFPRKPRHRKAVGQSVRKHWNT
jgi:hypothetical protein